MSPSKKKPRTDLQKLQEQAKAHGYELKNIPVPRPEGRPTLYNKDFHPGDYVRMATEGKTKAQICAEWGIHRATLHEWATQRDKKEFTDAIKAGDEARSSWWTSLGLNIAAGRLRGSNATMAIFMMKNIVPNDYRDRIDHTHTLDVEDMEFGE